MKKKSISEKRLLQLIYGTKITVTISAQKKRIQRLLDDINFKGKANVEARKYEAGIEIIKNKKRYVIKSMVNKHSNSKTEKVRVRTYLEASSRHREMVNKHLDKDISERLIKIEGYISKDGSYKDYDMALPLAPIQHPTDKKHAFFWAIITNPPQIQSGTHISIDPEIKRFYFSRIKHIHSLLPARGRQSHTKSFLSSLTKEMPEIVQHGLDHKNMIDDFGYLIQVNYSKKKFTFHADPYFHKLLETQHGELFQVIKQEKRIKKIDGKGKANLFEITIHYVDMQRIANLIFPFLDHIRVKETKDAAEIQAYMMNKIKKWSELRKNRQQNK